MIVFNLLYLTTGISALLVQRQGNSQCAQWCAANFQPNPGKDCTSLAAKSQGPCFHCGPAAPQPLTQLLCNRVCVPIDNSNCGSCGNRCTGGKTCQSGNCVASTTYKCPPQDALGFSLGFSNTSSDPIFCSYPAVPGEDPNDFFCTYSRTTGVLVTDNDAGLCPAQAPTT